MKRIAVLALALLLLLSACKGAGPEPEPTIEPSSAIPLQPLPDNCRLLQRSKRLWPQAAAKHSWRK